MGGLLFVLRVVISEPFDNPPFDFFALSCSPLASRELMLFSVVLYGEGGATSLARPLPALPWRPWTLTGSLSLSLGGLGDPLGILVVEFWLLLRVFGGRLCIVFFSIIVLIVLSWKAFKINQT